MYNMYTDALFIVSMVKYWNFIDNSKIMQEVHQSAKTNHKVDIM
jgi:hypothetical protein